MGKPVSSENPVHHVVLLSDSREVLEANTVTLAPDRNWKAKLFPSLSSDFAENSAERARDRKTDSSVMRQIVQPIMMQDANKGEQDTVTLFTKTHNTIRRELKQIPLYTKSTRSVRTLSVFRRQSC